jgi:hypothetical protein
MDGKGVLPGTAPGNSGKCCRAQRIGEVGTGLPESQDNFQ